MNDQRRGEDTPILFGEFREWMDHYEAEQESQRLQLGEITKNVSHLTANVQTLLDNQKGLFSRVNRPTNWAAYIAGLAVVVSFSGLLFAPVQREITRQHEFDLRVMEHLLEDAEQKGRTNTELEWVKRMEERYNSRMHRGVSK